VIIDHAGIIASLEKEKADIEGRKAQLRAKFDQRMADLDKKATLIDETIGVHQKWQEHKQGSDTITFLTEYSVSEFLKKDEPPISRNAFKNLSVIEAVKKFLKMVKTGKTNPEICDALREGGIGIKRGRYLKDTVRTALRRRGEKNGIIRIGEKYWAVEYAPKEPEKSTSVFIQDDQVVDKEGNAIPSQTQDYSEPSSSPISS
jgi:hypothetical protein